MGVIAFKNDIILFHIAKCAGTSMEQFFNQQMPNENAHIHISKGIPNLKKDYALWEILDTQELTTKKPPVTDDAFVVSCVRNSYDQVVSHFHYHKKRGTIPEDYEFSEYVNQMYYEEKFTKDLDHMRQYKIINCPYEKVRADFILYFANIKKDMETVCKYLNKKYQKIIFDPIKFASNYHVNKTKHHIYKKYYNENLKSKVYGMLKEDIDFFGYDFDDQKKVQNVGFTKHFQSKNPL